VTCHGFSHSLETTVYPFPLPELPLGKLSYIAIVVPLLTFLARFLLFLFSKMRARVLPEAEMFRVLTDQTGRRCYFHNRSSITGWFRATSGAGQTQEHFLGPACKRVVLVSLLTWGFADRRLRYGYAFAIAFVRRWPGKGHHRKVRSDL
jgi:hypothetical protein